jgi:ankyrin repeat protein
MMFSSVIHSRIVREIKRCRLPKFFDCVEQGNHGELESVLLRSGANPNAYRCRSFGKNALIKAADEGCSEVVDVLVKAGANLDLQCKLGDTALIRAALCGRAEVAKVLADAGANLNLQDKRGYTALNIAAHGGHIAVAKVLTDANAQLISSKRARRRRA